MKSGEAPGAMRKAAFITELILFAGAAFTVMWAFYMYATRPWLYAAISVVQGAIFAGYTSGAALQAVKQLEEAGEFDADSKVVVIFPDHGSRYMSKVYSDHWMEAQGFFDSKNIGQARKIEYVK